MVKDQFEQLDSGALFAHPCLVLFCLVVLWRQPSNRMSAIFNRFGNVSIRDHMSIFEFFKFGEAYGLIVPGKFTATYSMLTSYYDIKYLNHQLAFKADVITTYTNTYLYHRVTNIDFTHSCYLKEQVDTGRRRVPAVPAPGQQESWLLCYYNITIIIVIIFN